MINWYAAAFIMGLAGSLHCLAMCGPIFAAVSGFYTQPKEYFRPLLLHHFGKIVSYASIGLFMGFIGQGISLVVFQNTLMLACGILLLFVAVSGMAKWTVMDQLNAKITYAMSRILGKNRGGGFLLGLINGWVPCGLVYAAAIGATATQSIIEGAGFMLFFGLGTIPILSLAGFSRWMIKLKRVPNLAIWKQIPALILGLIFFLKGLGLGIPFISPDLGSHESSKNCCARHHPRH
jgi:uncharacterized protein